MTDLNRRELLAGGASLTMLMALGGCETIFRQIRNRPVRRDLATMAPNDVMLQAYRDGVAQMINLDNTHPDDPRSWSNWAGVHASSCPHRNWFFLPWHRAYLMSLERIIRELTQVRNFALPYWNWSCERAVPAPFWEGPLSHANRAIGRTDQADSAIVGPSNINTILAETEFELFASGRSRTLRGRSTMGPLESGPHNYIHSSFIRGSMGSTDTAARDPIFWMHHNILDYLWFDWNSRGNANSDDPVYTNMMISGQMVDGAGNPIDYKVGMLVLAPLLAYRFAPPAGCFDISLFLSDEVNLRRFLERGAEVRLRPRIAFPPLARGMSLDARQRGGARVELPAEGVRAALAANPRGRLILRVDDIRPPTDGTYVRVFVGLPEGEAPSPDSPHYAGAFAFFVGNHDGHDAALDCHVDLTPAFDKLRATGRLRDPENAGVTFVPVRPEQPRASADSVISVGSVVPLLIDRKPKPARPR